MLLSADTNLMALKGLSVKLTVAQPAVGSSPALMGG